MLRYTTPSSYMAGPPSAALCLERGIEPREHVARVALIDEEALFLVEIGRRIDIAPRVVVGVAGLRIDAAHRADHLGGKQDVLHRNHLRQQIDARLVIDAGVEED